jgi:peroxin-6
MRRRLDRPPISARLLVDDRLQGQAGVLSEDLFTDLFRGYDFTGMFRHSSGMLGLISNPSQVMAIAPLPTSMSP